MNLLPAFMAIGIISIGGCSKNEPPRSSDPALAGKVAFDKHQCAVCHREGGIGKALVGVGTRLKREQIRAWIADPTKVKPDTLMPKLELSEAELDAVTDYVMSLK